VTTATRKRPAAKPTEPPPEAEPATGALVKPDPRDAEPLLTLSTLAPKRPTVDIDGTHYELNVMNDFGLRDQQRLTHDGREYQALFSAEDELTTAQSARLDLLLERMYAMAWHKPLPRTIEAKLGDEQRAQVVVVFTRGPLLMAIQAQVKAETEKAEMEAREGSTMAS
jgi:hypothetical protein